MKLRKTEIVLLHEVTILKNFTARLVEQVNAEDELTVTPYFMLSILYLGQIIYDLKLKPVLSLLELIYDICCVLCYSEDFYCILQSGRMTFLNIIKFCTFSLCPRCFTDNL